MHFLLKVRAWDPRKPLYFAPAMNTMMWENPLTFQHRNTLKDLLRYKVVWTSYLRPNWNEWSKKMEGIFGISVTERNRNWQTFFERRYKIFYLRVCSYFAAGATGQIGRATHTYRFLQGDRSRKIDTYDLPGEPVAPVTKCEQTLMRANSRFSSVVFFFRNIFASSNFMK